MPERFPPGGKPDQERSTPTAQPPPGEPWFPFHGSAGQASGAPNAAPGPPAHPAPMDAPPGWRPVPPIPAGPPPDAMPPYRPSRAPWVLVVILSLLLGLGGGAAGAFLVDAANRGDTLPSTEPAKPRAPEPAPADPSASGPGQSPVVAVAEGVLPSVVSLEVTGGTSRVGGSGFVYDDEGRVVTNNHVIEPAVDDGEITVSFPDGREVTASIVGRSPSYDIAVIQIDGAAEAPAVRLGSSDDVEVGQSVVAIGSPLGLNATVTAGIISATERPVIAGGIGETSYINALQTDAAINPGNSGGPLVDLEGQVIGVNSVIATLGGSDRQSGNIGVGFSIPIDQVVHTVTQIIETGHAEYPIIGARVSVAEGTDGALVDEVTTDSPAATAGLQEGDVITAVNGAEVSDGVALIVKIRSFEPGETITLKARRDGQSRSYEVTLGKKIG